MCKEMKRVANAMHSHRVKIRYGEDGAKFDRVAESVSRSFPFLKTNGPNICHTGESQCIRTLIKLPSVAMSDFVSKRVTSENILHCTSIK